MKKLILLAAVLATIAVPTQSKAHSGSYSYYTFSAPAVNGSALASDVIDARELESLVITVSAVTADRVATVSCLAADKTTALYSFPTVTAAVAGVAKQYILIYPDAVVPATAPTGTTIWNVALCPYMQVSLASAAGTGQLDIIGRRQQVAAQVSRCPSSTDRSLAYCYESGSVTAGAAIASPVMDTRRFESLTILVEATTTGRALVLSCTDSSGTSLFDFASFTVTAANKYLLNVRPDSATPGTEPTNVTHFPVQLCRYMKASIAAAGAASAKLATYLR